ncbi:N-acetyltransferase [Actinobacillus succinogenes]|uniref:GCN5-related N-acetyltransferase n=1 Tax=Actinobacillus succinogenes (strain ATCC 55618 / DSM 22257 / CCUG 43843 / 130Z) TaxID=339671 RepID=A6VR45_ACTSZ|nr:GNAT family N-acetyltransferase [Actinobacillus succinogenes]ABR75442.1 GCN5-related N-acetyltransferase [Actinobacillus succinogenes 130Z]PHI40170.1 N-acetyltransferase [Actinobacillus succinogenes]
MLNIKPLPAEKHEWFITALQQAFRQAVQDSLQDGEEIISRGEIESAMQGKKAESLLIEQNGDPVGGAVVKIDPQTQRNELELFFIRTEKHGKGIGQQAWKLIEQRYPQTETWETHTPYFEKRNIHFYLKCGFHIVAFYRDRAHSDNRRHDTMPDEMFRFEKEMNNGQRD